jgi:hypothetical protein
MVAAPWNRPGYENWVHFNPGYDCITSPCGRNGCGTNPGASHGRHGVEMRWLLRRTDTGDTVQFVVYTDWGPPPPGTDPLAVSLHPVATAASRGEYGAAALFPMAADLGHHRTVAVDYEPPEDAWEYLADCAYTPTGRCSYDGSGLNAGPVLALLAESGGDAVWEHLLEYHQQVFP